MSEEIERLTARIRELERARAALSETEERFRIMADIAPVMIWMSGTDKLCNYFNQTWLDFTGKPLEDELGDGWTKGVHPEDIACCLDTYVRCFDARQHFRMEYRLRRADGEYRWILDTGRPRYDADGGFAGYIGSCIDITDQKEVSALLEKRVNERTEELAAANQQLKRSNTDLEQFAFVVSHDLQEPLRTVGNFARLLSERYRDRLDQDASEFIDFLVDATVRMQALVRDLLELSKVDSRRQAAAPVDAGAACRKALENLKTAVEDSAALITLEPLPVIVADEGQLIELFQNLLANAIKYRSERPPVVRISARRQGERWQFCVEDNGIGVHRENADRIFTMFRRAGGSAGKPGAGIGLAVCKRIVERHRGHIWVESQPGAGSRFYFTIPAIMEGEGDPNANA